MKSIYLIILFLICTFGLNAQISINPNSGTIGTSFGVTITGQNFMSASSTNAYINTSPNINLTGFSASSSNITGNFSIPINTIPGAYGVVVPGSPTFSCGGCFTIIGPLIAADKSDALQSEIYPDGNVNPGETVRFTVVVSNTGNANATNVVYANPAISNASLVVGSVTTDQGTVGTGNTGGDTDVNVNIGTILMSSSVTLSFDVVVDESFTGSQISCQGTVSGDVFSLKNTNDPDTGPANDATVVSVVQHPKLTATKTGAVVMPEDIMDGQVNPGETIRFSVTISNENNAPTASSLTYNNAAINNASLVVGSVMTSTGSVTTGNNGGDMDVEVNVGSINPASSALITFDVVVDNPIFVDEIVCQGEVSGSNFLTLVTDDPDTGAADDSTRMPILVVPPTISLLKEVEIMDDLIVDGFANAGEKLKYTLVMTNSHPIVDGYGLQLASAIPANTSLVIGSVTSNNGSIVEGNTLGDTEVLVDIPTLAANGGSVTITFEVQLDDPLYLSSGMISCQSLLTGFNFDDILSDDPNVGGSEDPTLAPVMITLTNQTDINNFASNFSNPTTFANLTISDDNNGIDNITNLLGLMALTSIGNLVISGNDELPNLDGLQSLGIVQNDLIIVDNAMLVDLLALGTNSLQTVGRDLVIARNPSLQNLDGLNALTSVGGNFILKENPSLTQINGIMNLNAIGGDLQIIGNKNLSSCQGIAALIQDSGMAVDGNIMIDDNSTGCNSVEEVEASLIVIPTLSEWGIIFLFLLSLITGLLAVKQRFQLASTP
jgi:uncharacterized repeat protein (TIGR01451 family)